MQTGPAEVENMIAAQVKELFKVDRGGVGKYIIKHYKAEKPMKLAYD